MEKDDRMERVECKIDTLLGYFQDDKTSKGVFSRIGRLEDHVKTAVKVRWFLFCALFGLVIKAFAL